MMKKALLKLGLRSTHNRRANYSCDQKIDNSGFALPMSIALGLCMIALGLTTVIIAQDDRDSAFLRRDVAASLLTSDSAIAEILTDFSLQENSILLGQSFDPVNQKTGKIFLGMDGIPNSGDEKKTPIDEWSSLNPHCLSEQGLSKPTLTLTNSISNKSSYKILAYRFSPQNQSGHLLVEGVHNGITSHVYVNLELSHDSSGFPGVVASTSVYWQGRSLEGRNGNLYFNPKASLDETLSEKANVGDSNRPTYLNAIWSGPTDGSFTDQVQGKLVACPLTYTLPASPQGKNLGFIKSSLSLSGQGSGGIDYQADGIELSGTDELMVDTTAGPVHLYVNSATVLRDSAKIRNVRTDGAPPQVGDLRIIQTRTESAPVALFDSTCIDHAFVYSPYVD
ncbi:MAG: hypothetical protein WA902_10805, partial [Thermosynechococcaceae cyanobacterium]